MTKTPDNLGLHSDFFTTKNTKNMKAHSSIFFMPFTLFMVFVLFSTER